MRVAFFIASVVLTAGAAAGGCAGAETTGCAGESEHNIIRNS